MDSKEILPILIKCTTTVALFGVGASTEPSSVWRMLRAPLRPRPSESLALLTTIAAIFLVMPLVAFLILHWAPLEQSVKLGLFVISFSPGGPASNTLALMSSANFRLNVAATSIASLLAVPALPLFVCVYLQGNVSDIPFGQAMKTVAFILGPLLLGMLLRSRCPLIGARAERAFGALGSLLILAVASVSGVPMLGWEVFGLAVALACTGFVLGAALGWLIGADAPTVMAMSLETAIHDVPMANLVIMNIFGDVPGIMQGVQACLLYGWVTLVLGFVLTVSWAACSRCRRSKEAKQVEEGAQKNENSSRMEDDDEEETEEESSQESSQESNEESSV